MRATASTTALQAGGGLEAPRARKEFFVSTIKVPPCDIGDRAYHISTNKLFVTINARAISPFDPFPPGSRSTHDPTETTPHRPRDRLDPRRPLRRKARALDPRDRQAAHRPCLRAHRPARSPAAVLQRAAVAGLRAGQ